MSQLETKPSASTAASTADATADPAAGTSRRARRSWGGLPRRLWNWIWGVSVVAAARSELARRSDRQQADLTLALTTRHFADRTLYPADPPAHGSPVPVARSLYRDAAFWAVSALLPDPPPADAGDAFDRAPEDVLARAAQTPEQRAALRAAFVGGSADWARRPAGEQRAALDVLDAFGTAALDEVMRPQRRLRRVVGRRAVVGFAGLVLAVGAALGVSAAVQKPSLTAGKPWRTSTVYVECHPREHLCDSKRTDIFFHTLEEDSPWVEFDLLEPTVFRKVVVANRTDCCPDRAVPLILEVSDDQQHWRALAEQKETFGTWTARFPRERARFIRLRTQRRSLLHLEAVDVYR
jgi:hypothetical protein